jgi:hypothetical protein
MRPVRVTANVTPDVISGVFLPWQNLVPSGFVAEHLLEALPAILEEARPRQAAVQVNSPANLTVLVSYEIFDAMVYLTLDPTDDPVKEMMNEICTGLRLLERKTPHPRKRRCAKCYGDKPLPISSRSSITKTIDELGHSIRVAEIARTRCAVLSSSEWAA